VRRWKETASRSRHMQSIKSEAWEKNGMTSAAKFNYTKLIQTHFLDVIENEKGFSLIRSVHETHKEHSYWLRLDYRSSQIKALRVIPSLVWRLCCPWFSGRFWRRLYWRTDLRGNVYCPIKQSFCCSAIPKHDSIQAMQDCGFIEPGFATRGPEVCQGVLK